VVGGKLAAQKAKADLAALGLIATAAGGVDGARFAVKRPVLAASKGGRPTRLSVIAVREAINGV
jgi:hypothetical protein